MFIIQIFLILFLLLYQRKWEPSKQLLTNWQPDCPVQKNPQKYTLGKRVCKLSLYCGCRWHHFLSMHRQPNWLQSCQSLKRNCCHFKFRHSSIKFLLSEFFLCKIGLFNLFSDDFACNWRLTHVYKTAGRLENHLKRELNLKWYFSKLNLNFECWNISNAEENHFSDYLYSGM